ncbi:MAG: ferredoxin, partial [Candidatus Latescibacterota bacterium]
MADKEPQSQLNRREVMRVGLSAVAGLAVAGVSGLLAGKSSSQEMVWQLDPNLCIQCEKCSTNCVLPESAVKCVHSYSMCGYCDLCSGYLEPGAPSHDTGAESQLCPTGAI